MPIIQLKPAQFDYCVKLIHYKLVQFGNKQLKWSSVVIQLKPVQW